MAYLLPIFKTVSMVFAISAVATGAQAIVDPIGFSRSFGLALSPTRTDAVEPSPIDNKDNKVTSGPTTTILLDNRSLAMSYISLMGVRQLATGFILLAFAYQDKWSEMATILAIIGIIVAGTDGIYLSRAGARELGLFHAIPGALIAALAWVVVLYE